jgi:hypothetical protein
MSGRWGWVLAFLTATIAGSFLSNVSGYLRGAPYYTATILSWGLMLEQLALLTYAVYWLLRPEPEEV